MATPAQVDLLMAGPWALGDTARHNDRDRDQVSGGGGPVFGAKLSCTRLACDVGQADLRGRQANRPFHFRQSRFGNTST